MGSSWGGAGSTAVRSLPLPLGPAMEVGEFFDNCDDISWLLLPQDDLIAQKSSQGTSAALTSIARMVLGTCCLVAFAWLLSSDQRRKLLNIRTALYSSDANECCAFKSFVGETSRRKTHTVGQVLCGAGKFINVIFVKQPP